MLAWFRNRGRPVSALALVALVTLTLSSATPHEDDCHGAGCGVSLPHEPSAHSIGRDTNSTEHPLHCVLCHWTRLVRPPADSAHALASAAEAVRRTFVDIQRASQQFSAAQPPLRAPPASPAVA
jgi:hypothetical protein